MEKYLPIFALLTMFIASLANAIDRAHSWPHNV
jgi:hypothetical protein